jgi:hypothetical protein
MNVDLAQELLNELGSSLENVETQHAALLQFLKDNDIVTDEQLAPYLAQAGKASSVRWRVARIRLERLFSTEKQQEEQLAEKGLHKTGGAQPPIQYLEKQGSNEASGKAVPNNETVETNASTESAEAQSNPHKGNKQGATSADKKPSPKREENAP